MDAIIAFDRQLYAAIVTAVANNLFLEIFTIAVAYLNWNGFIWWIAGLFVARARDFGRRGVWAALTVYFGLCAGWLTSELLKLVFQRPRPFTDVVDLPRPLIDEPTTFSFPSGDATFASAPPWRWDTWLRRGAFPRAALRGGGRVRARRGRRAIPPSRRDGRRDHRHVLRAHRAAPRRAHPPPRQMASVRGPHTHWDVSGTSGSRISRAPHPMVSKLLDLLERDSEFRSFTFDGHTIWAEDYLEKRPADRPRIEALVRAERLFIGPWYVLADNLLVSGESLLRNFQEGLRVSASFGRAMRVGYVADPFGHPAQTPQLLRLPAKARRVRAASVRRRARRCRVPMQAPRATGPGHHLVDPYSAGCTRRRSGGETGAASRTRTPRPSHAGRTTAYANGAACCSWSARSRHAYARLPAPSRPARGGAESRWRSRA